MSLNKGRPGMDQWSILVLGSLRVGLNTDHDRILELANQHRTLREMLGLGCFDVDKRYCLQTLKDNLDTDLHTFSRHAERQIDQIRRRALQGEAIPDAEKVFSLFQPTEWISKGRACPKPCRRAGVPVELGLRVCIMEDSHGFILHSLVMQKTTDNKVAVPMVKATQALFLSFKACSFDKAFHGPDNQKELKNLMDQVVLPKKGNLSKADQEREYAPEFKQARKQHSAVESAINALEVHGLDKCPDHGIDGFERYVALAVLSRNIQKLGTIIRDQERERLLKEKQAA